jgi:hypothetical protein
MHTLSQQKEFYSTGLREGERETRNFNFGFKKIALIFSFSKLTNFERGEIKRIHRTDRNATKLFRNKLECLSLQNTYTLA